jgi:hypothetical protein
MPDTRVLCLDFVYHNGHHVYVDLGPFLPPLSLEVCELVMRPAQTV